MNIELAQAWLKSQSLDAYFHYHTDPHQSEYLADHWQVMAWLTGFTGSAGTVVFTQNGAALWADSRYYLQAEKQLEGSGIALMKTGLPGTQATDEWLKEQLPEGGTVGIDPNLISITPYFTTKKSLQAQGFELMPVLGCLEAIWADRPPLSTSRVKEHDVLYAGQSREEKLTAVRAKMLKNKADVLLIPTLDDLAWLLNLRGSDIDFNPVFMSYLLIEADSATLFVDSAKVPQSIASDLASAGVGIRPYDSVLDAIASIPEALSIWLDYGRSNYALYQAIPAGRNMVKSALPTILMKACKNATEQAHTRASHIRDGVAMAHFLHWLDRSIGREPITELSAAQKLDSFRQAQPGYLGQSFSPIPGYAEHGALPHYSVTPESNATLQPEGIFLIDSGGQYPDGTTDITRTVALGPVTEEMKRDFTLVLKGHIALDQAVFPTGTQGVQLDVLARQYLWKAAKNYGHGTGHGVGFFLNVHEGPTGISTKVNPQPPLEPGMLLSNEPGMYKTGEYGIRIENLMFVQEQEKTDFGTFLCFESVTLCPIDKRLISAAMLSEEERQWLNRYHARVREAIGPLVEGEVREWITQATAAM